MSAIKKVLKNEVYNLPYYIVIFCILSAIGWLYETILASIRMGHFVDTGFLYLSITPIYGISVIVFYLLFGTPKNMKIFGLKSNKIINKKANYYIYFLFAVLVPTFMELVVGFVFDIFFNIRLWDYSSWIMNFKGYISLPVSLFWGVSLTLGMAFVFDRLLKLTKKINRKTVVNLSYIIILFIILDLIAQFVIKVIM